MTPFVRNVLAIAIAANLSIPATSNAATLTPGQSATVQPGDVPEAWTLQGAELIINPGAGANRTTAADGSTVNVTGGAITHSGSTAALELSSESTAGFNAGRLTNTAGTALSLIVSSSSLVGSRASFGNGSVINGVGSAVNMSSGSALTLSDSTISASGGTIFDGAITTFGGAISILDGSVIQGDSHGISVLMADSGTSRPGDGVIVIDGSSVSASTGSGIAVSSFPGSTLTVTDIFVRGGSTISGGDGNLLTVEQGFATGTVTTANLTVEQSVLNGNVQVASDGSKGNVTLMNGGRINGIFTNVDQADINSGGYWQLTGDSSVVGLGLQAGGIVELGNGSAFHTLNVTGNYAGNGGTLLFNTVLAGDDAASDKLIIGGDTSGQTNVQVNNVGGAGAQTVNGIQVISVAGASNGQFDLAGRAVGGQYEYFLFKGTGADGNWYLRSQLPTAPDPCDADPSLPGCTPVDPPVDPPVGPPVDPPIPVLRPEGGAYLANLQATQTLFRLGYHDRHAGQNSGRAWARVDGARTGFDAISQQLDVKGNSQALSVGADVWRNDSGSGVGVMLYSGNATSTSTNPLSGYYARGKVKGEALGVYGTWRAGGAADPYAGFYLDGSVQRAQFRNRVEGVGLITERYDSRGWQGAIETGYAFRVGGAQNGGIFLEPQLQVGYNRWDDLHHTEANGTVVTTQDADGLYGRAGLRLSGVTRWGDGSAEVQPYLAANWLHTRAESQVWMDNERVEARIPRSRAEVSAGASLKFANGVGAWVGLARQQASGYHQTSAQLGMSYSW
jgi:autotransporter family porin